MKIGARPYFSSRRNCSVSRMIDNRQKKRMLRAIPKKRMRSRKLFCRIYFITVPASGLYCVNENCVLLETDEAFDAVCLGALLRLVVTCKAILTALQVLTKTIIGKVFLDSS